MNRGRTRPVASCSRDACRRRQPVWLLREQRESDATNNGGHAFKRNVVGSEQSDRVIGKTQVKDAAEAAFLRVEET